MLFDFFFREFLICFNQISIQVQLDESEGSTLGGNC